MPAKKKAAAKKVPTAPVVPDYVRDSRVYQKRTVTKRKLPSFQEAMYLLHVPEMAREYFAAVLAGLKAGDKTALEHAGEMLTYVQRRGFNINIAQQMLQQNAVAGADSPVIGCDAFLRRLADERAGHALPAPVVIEQTELRPAEIAPEAGV
jgi:hypothetical protein